MPFCRFMNLKMRSMVFEDSLFEECYFEDITSSNTFFKNCTFIATLFYNTGERAAVAGCSFVTAALPFTVFKLLSATSVQRLQQLRLFVINPHRIWFFLPHFDLLILFQTLPVTSFLSPSVKKRERQTTAVTASLRCGTSTLCNGRGGAEAPLL